MKPLVISTQKNLRDLLGKYFVDHKEYELNRLYNCTKCGCETKAKDLVNLPTKNTKVYECKSCAAKRKRKWYYENQVRILQQKKEYGRFHKPKRTKEQIKKHRESNRWFFRYSKRVYELGHKSTKNLPIKIKKEICMARLVKLKKKNILQGNDALFLLKKVLDAQPSNINLLIKSLFTIKVQEFSNGTTNT